MSSVRRLWVTKVLASLGGGIVGSVIVGPSLNWLLTGEVEWPTKPMSDYGSIAGLLVCGTLAGKKVGLVGWSFLIFTTCGLTLGASLHEMIGKTDIFCPIIGLVGGMTLGILVGAKMESNYGRCGSQKYNHDRDMQTIENTETTGSES